MFAGQYHKRLVVYRKLGFSVRSSDTGRQTAKAIYDSGDYLPVFERDLVEADREIIVASPDLRPGKTERFLKIIRSRQEAGVQVTVITRSPDEIQYGDSSTTAEIIRDMKKCGVSVRCTEDESQHYAVIDRQLVWHGGMNLLGREDAWDNLIRVRSVQAAAELLEISERDSTIAYEGS